MSVRKCLDHMGTKSPQQAAVTGSAFRTVRGAGTESASASSACPFARGTAGPCAADWNSPHCERLMAASEPRRGRSPWGAGAHAGELTRLAGASLPAPGRWRVASGRWSARAAGCTSAGGLARQSVVIGGDVQAEPMAGNIPSRAALCKNRLGSSVAASSRGPSC